MNQSVWTKTKKSSTISNLFLREKEQDVGSLKTLSDKYKESDEMRRKESTILQEKLTRTKTGECLQWEKNGYRGGCPITSE